MYFVKHLIFLFLVLTGFVTLLNAQPTPPSQPEYGPGGREYRYSKVKKTVYGKGANQYWIFEPDEPKPNSSPLVIFNHGWGAMNPFFYGAWIEHIVKRGNIVVYPVYQDNWVYPPKLITANTINAVKEAIVQLRSSSNYVQPELDKFAIVGHSAGGQITANMAALVKTEGIPEPSAIMCVQPGKSWSKNKKITIPLENLSEISSHTLLLCIVGDKDRVVKDIDAKKIFYNTTRIPAGNKDFIIFVSDDYGSPELHANHFSPCAPHKDYYNDTSQNNNAKTGPIRTKLNEKKEAELQNKNDQDTEEYPEIDSLSVAINAIDFYGLWKLFDGLCDAAFYKINREYALGKTTAQKYMGKWSDGTLVKELIVTDEP